jgi:hypothetical protein
MTVRCMILSIGASKDGLAAREVSPREHNRQLHRRKE